VSFVGKDLGDHKYAMVDGGSVLRRKCGRDHVDDPPERRFMERLPDGTRKPYMVHRPFRGWSSDEDRGG